MNRSTWRRVALGVLRILAIVGVVSFVASALVELVPGDPATAILGDSASPERYAEVQTELELDQPLMSRYGSWLGDAVKGDLGRSIIPPTDKVTDTIAARLPVTLQLTVLAMIFSLAGAFAAVLISARRPGGPLDSSISAVALAGVSMPSFLVALGLIYAFVFNPSLVSSILFVGAGVALIATIGLTIRARSRPGARSSPRKLLVGGMIAAVVLLLLGLLLPEFPRQGFSRLTDPGGLGENLRTILLPAITLSVLEGAVFTRVLRADVLETMDEEYIVAARAKGLPLSTILRRDALRPSSLSLVTVAGVAFGRLLGGTVIVETIFNLPGMGSLLVEAVQAKNFPIVQASVVILAALFVLINTFVDLSYRMLDPRIRRG